MTATLDEPVLAVLAESGKPMTVGEIVALTPRGSEIGVRKSLARLVEQCSRHRAMTTGPPQTLSAAPHPAAPNWQSPLLHLDLRDAAHYYAMGVAARKARDARRRGALLVERTTQEAER